MIEPSDCPPKWNSAFSAQVTHGVSVQASSGHWELEFVQPAADYFGFKKRLESQNVCLENVFVNDTALRVTGTLKEKNLSFHKEVNIRFTFDNWKSYRDCQATHVPVQAFPDNPHSLDTFCFSFDIYKDVTVDKLDFCIQFKSEGMEFWDNNQGKNYTIRKVLQRRREPSSIANVKKQERPNNHVTCNDPLQMSFESWSEFAGWNHFDTAGPYW
jgi:protein phosphatase 1 regulatory subunit 3A/B/C/D/E